MAELGPKTQANLKAAFAGESQARNKYAYFAKAAREEGLHYIAKIFEETAENEVQHAKEEFKLLKGISNTAANLKCAIEGECYETQTMYPTFAKEAEEEGHRDVAVQFKQIARVEAEHEKRFRALLKMVEGGTVFKREQPIRWRCMKCGLIHEGTQPPKICIACKHPMEYFEPADMDITI
ncbi:MAG TPA: rubrerythrin family protein [Candidatus Omnitrophota bacterium]|nr:rubrerythrin family protein [Candidatus Omnitrophota bacterium]HSA30394.1 rubrerythrin family protein [Candidatus Omnitrophota bacterium]